MANQTQLRAIQNLAQRQQQIARARIPEVSITSETPEPEKIQAQQIQEEQSQAQQIQEEQSQEQKDWNVAIKSAVTGHGSTHNTARSNYLYNLMLGRIPLTKETGLSSEEMNLIKEIQGQVRGQEYQKTFEESPIEAAQRLWQERGAASKGITATKPTVTTITGPPPTTSTITPGSTITPKTRAEIQAEYGDRVIQREDIKWKDVPSFNVPIKTDKKVLIPVNVPESKISIEEATKTNVFQGGTKTSSSQAVNIISETKRYENLGYNKKEAEKLAKESVSRGGVTYKKEEKEKSEVIGLLLSPAKVTKIDSKTRIKEFPSGTKTSFEQTNVPVTGLTMGLAEAAKKDVLKLVEPIREWGGWGKQVGTGYTTEKLVTETIGGKTYQPRMENIITLGDVVSVPSQVVSEVSYFAGLGGEAIGTGLETVSKRMEDRYGLTIRGGEVVPKFGFWGAGETAKLKKGSEILAGTVPYLLGGELGVGGKVFKLGLVPYTYSASQIARASTPITNAEIRRIALDNYSQLFPELRMPFEEYLSQVSPQIKLQLQEQRGLSIAGNVAFLTFGAVKGVKRYKTAIEEERKAEALAKQLKELEKQPYEFLQFEKGRPFEVQRKRIGGGFEENVYGLGQTSKGGMSYGLGIQEIKGTFTYKNFWGRTKELGYTQIKMFESGAKALPWSIKRTGDVTYAIVKGGEYPIKVTETFYKVGENIEDVAFKLAQNVKVVGGKNLIFTESLAQPYPQPYPSPFEKVKDITKIRTPGEIGFNIKIPTEEAGGFIGGGKKSSTQFLESLYSSDLKLVAPKVTPPPKPVPTRRIPTKVISAFKANEFPTYVGGTNVEESLYTGTGQYERTTGGTTPGFRFGLTGDVVETGNVKLIDLKSDVKNIDLLNVKVDVGIGVGLKVVPTTKSALQQTPILKSDVKLLSLLKTVPQVKEIQKTIQSPAEILKAGVVQKSVQKQQQQQKQVQKQIQLLKQIQTPRLQIKTPQVPTIQIPIPSFGSVSKAKPSAKETLKGMFEIFKRVRGEDISIGEEVTLGGAGKKLKEVLKAGPEASGYIVKKQTGKKVPYRELADIFGGEFRPAKRDFFRIVQKKERRMGTAGEVFRIQKERKGKRKKGWF